MAIGDGFSILMGTAITNRQPSAGVFEQVGGIPKDNATDGIVTYDGTNSVNILATGVKTDNPQSAGNNITMNVYNMALLIGNTVYIRKNGTTYRIAVSGVQVDA